MSSMRRFATLPVLAVALVVGPPGAADAAPAPQQSAAVAHPTGADDVVLQVFTGGGFVPYEVALAAFPEYTLLGDGTVIVAGVSTLEYPGPALPSLNRFSLSEKQIQHVLHRAEEAGLLTPDPVDFGAPLITDVGTTSVTLNAAGLTVTHRAYALTITDAEAGLTSAQVRARRSLVGFLESLPQGGGDAGPYPPTALAVYVGEYSGDPQGQKALVWPLGDNLATVGTPTSVGAGYRCTLVTGRDLSTLMTSLAGATSRTPWVARAGDDTRYSVVVRPVLPGTPGCTER
jgi:hypothetical protein